MMLLEMIKIDVDACSDDMTTMMMWTMRTTTIMMMTMMMIMRMMPRGTPNDPLPRSHKDSGDLCHSSKASWQGL